MKLADAVRIYVEEKRASGVDFSKMARSLNSFRGLAGDISISEVQQRHVSNFLNGPHTSTPTWRAKYGLLRHFFLYWVARNEMRGLPLPTPRSPAVQTFVPYIYSRAELHRLFAAGRSSQKHPSCKIDAQTLRTFLIFLYATGALMNEGRRLHCEDVDLKRKRIAIRNDLANRSRDIPIGDDLCRVLKSYKNTKHSKSSTKNGPFFITIDGNGLKEGVIATSFRRAREVANIRRSDDSQYQPRLHDLRHTFAVHRMTSWFKHGADMNRMMPALAAYLGQVGLQSTERYLKMTPERFRKQLNILSPNKSHEHWRNNQELMRFVDAL